MLDSIAVKGSGYLSFDYDGIRHDIKDAEEVRRQLSSELEQSRIALAEHDQRIYAVARENALQMGCEKELEDAFAGMFQQTKMTENDLRIYNDLMQEISKTSNTLPFDEIKLLVLSIIQKEKAVKTRLRDLVEDDRIQRTSVFKDNSEVIEIFLAGNYVYFTGENYLDDQLKTLIQAANAYVDISNEHCFLLKKDALNLQAVHLGLVKLSSSTEAAV